MTIGVDKLLEGATATGAGEWVKTDEKRRTFQVVATGTGAVSATVDIEVSNDGENACDTAAMTIEVSGTDAAADGDQSEAPWKYHRANVTAIGAGTSVDVLMGK